MIKYEVHVDENGAKWWYLNGKLHREDGPAIEYADGSKHWWLNGQRHREDGPAVECADGSKFWWLNDRQYTEDEWLRLTTKPKEMTVAEISNALGYDIKIVKG